jgi:hypothetical protein
MERTDQDPWPALATLADYFCKGQFSLTPDRRAPAAHSSDENALLRATSGSGIVNLHHTITRYAIERVRHLLGRHEYDHMISAWAEFMGQKEIQPPAVLSGIDVGDDYPTFRSHVADGKEREALAVLMGMTTKVHGSRMLGDFLVRTICDLYRGDYDPHFLTGLGSVLWVVESYGDHPAVVQNALRQYLNYYITQKVY